MVFCNFYFCKEVRSRIFVPLELHRKFQRRGVFLFVCFSSIDISFIFMTLENPSQLWHVVHGLVHLLGTPFLCSPPKRLLCLHVSLRPTTCKKPLKAELALLFVPIALPYLLLAPVILYHYGQWACLSHHPNSKFLEDKRLVSLVCCISH